MFSIIICNYNNEKYLPKCIRSVIDQSFSDWELIFVDDGSTDNSIGICRRFASRDSRIKLVQKENGGLTSARLAGLDAAEGDYIAFLDSDDWMDKDFLRESYSIIKERAVDMVVFSYSRVFDSIGLLKSRHGLPSSVCGYHSHESFINKLYVQSLYSFNPAIPVFLWGKCYSKSLLSRANLHNEGVFMGEDRVWNLDLFLLAESVFISDYHAWCYRYGGVTARLNPGYFSDRKYYYKKASSIAACNSLKDWEPELAQTMFHFFMRYVEILILSKTPEQQAKSLITKELMDPTWREGQDVLSKGDRNDSLVSAVVNADIDLLYGLSKSSLVASSFRNKIKSIARRFF